MHFLGNKKGDSRYSNDVNTVYLQFDVDKSVICKTSVGNK